MDPIRKRLDEVFALLRHNRIVDPLSLVTAVGELLVRRYSSDSWMWEHEQIKPVTAQLTTDTLHEADRLLGQCVAEMQGDYARLFNSIVLFRLQESSPGDRFLTPHHIATAMAGLIQVSAFDRVADLACGSGSLLVATSSQESWGIELSTAWAHLAKLNLALHGRDPRQIIPGDAGMIAQQALPAPLDAVVMHPPQFRKGDNTLAESDFIDLAVERLGLGGRAGFILSSRVLQSSTALPSRAHLARSMAIQVVATLPRDAMQPFRGTPGHLLIGTKGAEVRYTWFLRLQADGYRPGRTRDLTQPPDYGPNDLDLLPQLVRLQTNERPGAWGEALYVTRWAETAEASAVSWPDRQSSQVRCVVFQPEQTYRADRYRLYRHADGSATLIFRLVDHDQFTPGWTAVTPTGRVVQLQNADSMIQEMFSRGVRPVLEADADLPGTEVGCPIAYTTDGVILGVGRSRVWELPDVNLLPETYVQTAERATAPASAAELLATVRRNQVRFLDHIHTVLGRLELRQTDRAIDLPEATAPALDDDGKWLEPFGPLSPEQTAVWGRIAVLSTGGRPVYFTPNVVCPDGQVIAEVIQTLDLFRRMGLIVSVVVDGKALLRRTAAGDLGPKE